MAKNKRKSMFATDVDDDLVISGYGYGPYPVPKNWRWTKLGMVCSLDSGKKHSNESLSYFDARALRSNIATIRDSGILVSKGQKVILVDGENSGEVFVIPYRGYMGSTFRLLNSIGGFNETYIRYFIDSNRNLLRNNKIGSAIPHLNKDIFYGLDLPVPPLSEQNRIVERIEILFSKLDEAKEKAQDVLKAFECRKAAMFHKAFTGELTAKWRKENGIDDRNWKNITLGELSEKVFDGPFGSNLKSEDYVDSGIRVVRLENLKNLWFDDSKQSFVTKEKYETIKRHTVYPSDLIMSTFIVDEIKVCQMPSYVKFAVNKADCIGIRLKENINKKYVLYYLSSKIVFNLLINQIHGATRPRVNTKQIKSINIFIPTIEEQCEIVRLLDEFTNGENKSRESAEVVIDQIDAMKKSIIKQAFRGKLGTNEPNDEVA